MVDKHPELVAHLRTNPPYREALALRHILLKHLQWDVESAQKRAVNGGKNQQPARPRHLKLV